MKLNPRGEIKLLIKERIIWNMHLATQPAIDPSASNTDRVMVNRSTLLKKRHHHYHFKTLCSFGNPLSGRCGIVSACQNYNDLRSDRIRPATSSCKQITCAPLAAAFSIHRKAASTHRSGDPASRICTKDKRTLRPTGGFLQIRGSG